MKKITGMMALAFAFLCILLISVNKCYAKDTDGDVVVVIDAGHGAHDPGSTATTGALEKDLNLAIAKAMKAELEKYDGIKIYLTHSDDEWMSNTGRAMIAASLNADFLISIHNNSGSESNTGCIVYRTLNETYAEAANDMGNRITENLAALGLYNGGVETRNSTIYEGEDYYTLIGEGVRAGIPSIIVEHCFISNPADAALVSDSDGTIKTEMTDKMGQADAMAVAEYFNLQLRQVTADSKTTVTLEKSDRITLTPAENGSGEVSWYAISNSVADVDADGVVTAIGEGTTNIVYKYDDGTTGYCVVKVLNEIPVSLTGGMNDTFYDTSEEMAAINKSDIFAFLTYSDGSSRKVTPDTIGDIDSAKTGFQDIEITYEDMKGNLRLCLQTSDFVPEKSVPVPTYEAPTRETSSDESIADETISENKKNDSGSRLEFKDIMVYIIVLAAVIVVGIILFIIERGRKKRRRRNRKRRRY